MTVNIKVEMTRREAMAFAQFLKRSTWDDFRSNAVDEDETYLMLDAVKKIQEALEDEGISPR